ncbi:MAG: hypothetical protein KZQ81_14400 [Candidatus Thiodiazotropha sp. (ex Rostrolucina anterorostrata)]|nr:hypothetical protein [Candidatus Thiodiazotropha sp. (ex Rostrolucina anterorostrata)]
MNDRTPISRNDIDRLDRSGFNVTGHSLGGFLATNLTFDYLTDIAHTYLYNAPGVTGVGGDILQAITNALTPDNSMAIPNLLPISNIIATGDDGTISFKAVAIDTLLSVSACNPFDPHL